MQPYRMPLRDIIAALRQTYCSYIGVEFLHIQNRKVRRWLIERLESDRNHPRIEPERKRIILEDLIRAEEFEHFLHSTFVGQKRFSLEGAEAIIPGLHFLVDSARRYGVEHFVDRHRAPRPADGAAPDPAHAGTGDLQPVPAEQLPPDYGGGGDVKYHIGYRPDHVASPTATLVHHQHGVQPEPPGSGGPGRRGQGPGDPAKERRP